MDLDGPTWTGTFTDDEGPVPIVVETGMGFMRVALRGVTYSGPRPDHMESDSGGPMPLGVWSVVVPAQGAKGRVFALEIDTRTFETVVDGTKGDFFEHVLVARLAADPSLQHVRTCFFCRWSDYSPGGGSGDYGNMLCFRRHKEVYAKADRAQVKWVVLRLEAERSCEPTGEFHTWVVYRSFCKLRR